MAKKLSKKVQQVRVEIQKEGKWFVISSRKYGITTQGRSIRDATANFQEALQLCFSDSDWRSVHGLQCTKNAKLAPFRPLTGLEVLDVSGKITAYLGLGAHQVPVQ